MIRWFSVRRLLVWTVLASGLLLAMVWLGRAIYRDASHEGRRGHSVIASRKARLQYKAKTRERSLEGAHGPIQMSGPKHKDSIDSLGDSKKTKEAVPSEDTPPLPIPLLLPEGHGVSLSSIVGTKWAVPFAFRHSEDLRAAWEVYLQYRQTHSELTLENYLWETFGVVAMSTGGGEAAKTKKVAPSIPKAGAYNSKQERMRFEASIRRHVALFYGEYRMRGGQERRHFNIPVCHTIGLGSEAGAGNGYKTKELERLEGSQGSLTFIDVSYVGPGGATMPWVVQHKELNGKLRLVVKNFAFHKDRKEHEDSEDGKQGSSSHRDPSRERRSSGDLRVFGKEHYALAAIQHPGVIQPVCYEKQPHLQMIYPYLAGGDLVTLSSDHLAYKDKTTGRLFTPDDTFLPRFFRQLVEAVYAVHAAGILHLDLKPENLVIHGPDRQFIIPSDHPALSAYHLVLLDFGLALPLEEAAQKNCLHIGTDVTMAPEQVLCNHAGGRGTDWWGLAAAMWRTRVFWEPSIGETERTNLLNAKCEQWGHPILPDQPWFTAEFKSLMRALLKPTPKERDFSHSQKRFQRLLDHPYLLRGLEPGAQRQRLQELGVARLEDLSLQLDLSESESEREEHSSTSGEERATTYAGYTTVSSA